MGNKQKIKLLSVLFFLIGQVIFAQDDFNVDYSVSPKKYEIQSIRVEGAESLDTTVVINFSDLKIGQKISIPGDEITTAVKKFWTQGLFSEVAIAVGKVEGDKVSLIIKIKQLPKISDIRFDGAKKSQVEDLTAIIGLSKDGQFTPNLEDQTRNAIIKYYQEKGYDNVVVNIVPDNDMSQPNSVIVNINIEKKDKIKVHKITLEGNQNLSNWKINRAMKKTNEKGKIINIFSTKKYVKSLYEADKDAIIEKYNEIGYRDARIVSDTVVRHNEKTVDITIKIDEGKKYYFGSINWSGNTIYTSDFLTQNLRIKKGDVYNGKLLNDRLFVDDDAVANLYQDNGYLFSNINPEETNISGDSIDFSMQVYEGRQAVINKIGITGNTRVYEHVVRRELRTKPGELYNKSDIIRTLRELAQMGLFDPEKMVPDIKPNPENGTVDIEYQLETKSSDQVELSAGYGGSTGITGSLGLKFTNFAIQNLFRPSTYRIVPQGEGQTLSIRGTTNARYYSSASISFLDPWFLGKRPNAFSVSGYFSTQSGVSNRNTSANSYYSQLLNGTQYPTYDADPDSYIRTYGASIGLGKRLTWPDDFFVLNTSLNYQLYSLKNWKYFIMENGKSNNFNVGISLSRSSIDNPLYTRSGSLFGLSLEITPPYSLINGKDYSDPNMPDTERYNWIEYHKWKFNSKIFVPLTPNQKLVLMARADYGFLGYYNPDRRSPFQNFVVGGDGLSGSSTSYASDIIGLRGYASGSLTPRTSSGSYNGNLYTRLTMELRYPLVTEGATTIYALAFVEGGNCWSDFYQFNPFDVKRAAGVGVRVFLPMLGLLGVDWGYGFDMVGNATRISQYGGSRFNFIIGQEF